MKVLLGTLVVASLLGNTGIAGAQTVREERRGGDDYFEFSDDGLLGSGIDGAVPRIHVRPKPNRALLLRPRVSFVQRMLQSVESL